MIAVVNKLKQEEEEPQTLAWGALGKLVQQVTCETSLKGSFPQETTKIKH